MSKIKVGIIGTGNIGTDLLFKVIRSPLLSCGVFAGRNPKSKGIALAREMGIYTSMDSIEAIVKQPDLCQVVFDATSAQIHLRHAPILKALGKYTIDLTPARVGKLCVPVLNKQACLYEDNINLITCGGQAAIPIGAAITEACQLHTESKVRYLELVASIASKSAGPGTRANIDEFTQVTREALMSFTGAPSAKAIIILNPGTPPMIMRNTIYALIEHPPMEEIKSQVLKMEKEIKRYVPGYRVIVGPIYENGRVTTTIEVLGRGDFMPTYSGNLDIITCAAVEMAEAYALRILGGQQELGRGESL